MIDVILTKLKTKKHCYIFLFTKPSLWTEISVQTGAWIWHIQSTLVISKSKELSETLRDIHISTNEICGIEENNKSNTFNK